MLNEFALSNNKVMINFTAKYCDTPQKVLDSEGFKVILKSYIEGIKKRNSNIYLYLEKSMEKQGIDETIQELVHVFKLLYGLKIEEIITINKKYESLLCEKDQVIAFIEGFYGYWRKLERYTIIHNKHKDEGLQNVSFIDANTNFSKCILTLYRIIEEKVLGYKPKVYRQLPAGGNAGLIVTQNTWRAPESYEHLKGVPFIDSIMINPPFIIYPKKNTRDGMFSEVFENPIQYCNINKNSWFCFPAKVGELLAYVYFNSDFMAHGVTLCNLFEMADEEEYMGRKPDILYVYGAKDNAGKTQTVFYDDVDNNMMVGYVSYNESIDYFGYMKKMILTLHNLIMIKRGFIPIHGAMVNIVMKDGNSANVIIMGDSGAGKSESLEAFRGLSRDYISDMTIIFDDMGVVKLDGNNKPLAYGTEIGAFVRLDDLDPGYAFKEIDRSIFMNPDRTNARLVIPVSNYKDIVRGYPIDLFLYANNYENAEDGKEIEFFNNAEEAIEVFKAGQRMAKGTTTEKGLVKSYFANPFGPAQKQKETDPLLDLYFKKFFKTGVKVGQIKTCLAIKGQEKQGPTNAALKLFEIIKTL